MALIKFTTKLTRRFDHEFWINGIKAIYLLFSRAKSHYLVSIFNTMKRGFLFVNKIASVKRGVLIRNCIRNRTSNTEIGRAKTC